MKKQIGKIQPIQKTWLSARETMAYMDCREDFLYNLRRDGVVSFSRVRGKFYYELRSLERLIEKNKVV